MREEIVTGANDAAIAATAYACRGSKQGMEIEMKDGLQHPVAVMGLPINSLTADEAVESLERLILSGGTHQICPVNVDTWLNALADPHLHRIMAGSTPGVARRNAAGVGRGTAGLPARRARHRGGPGAKAGRALRTQRLWNFSAGRQTRRGRTRRQAAGTQLIRACAS